MDKVLYRETKVRANMVRASMRLTTNKKVNLNPELDDISHLMQLQQNVECEQSDNACSKFIDKRQVFD